MRANCASFRNWVARATNILAALRACCTCEGVDYSPKLPAGPGKTTGLSAPSFDTDETPK
jgi:hypothetical protein